jgi:hypothetical protein
LTIMVLPSVGSGESAITEPPVKKQGRPKPPPQFQLTGSISTFGANKLAREGHYILPILRCPLLADADISTRPLR